MNQRTTFTLDKVTMDHLKFLAQKNGVSQAEVVRRAIDEAYTKASAPQDFMAQLESYHMKGGLAAEMAEAYLEEVAESRGEWRGPG